MGSQYDAFAEDYDRWLFSDERLTGEPQLKELGSRLKRLGSRPQVLDCACGTGVLVWALARHGYAVCGSDESRGMIDRARKRLDQAGLDVRLEVCPWERLGEEFGPRFDLVVCGGNAIGHCRDEAEMLDSLRGMRSVLKPGGMLILDTRNWEKYRKDRVRFESFSSPRVRDGIRCIVLYVRTTPESWSDPHLTEVVFILEQDGRVSQRSYPIVYWPFRYADLIARIRAAGFDAVESDHSENQDGYVVEARAHP